MRRHTPLGGALWLIVGFLTLVGMWMIIVLAAWGIWHTANALAAHPPEPITAHGGRAKPCNAVPCLRDALAWQRKDRAHLKHELRIVRLHGLTLDYIARIGASISGHPPAEFRAVGRCESTDVVTLEEYGFAGATGWLQYQWQTWTGSAVYRWFHGTIDYRKDPLVETVAAAVYLAHGGRWSGPWLASKRCHGLR